MRILLCLLVPTFLLLASGCQDDDQPIAPSNHFEVNGVTYLTPQAYLILDDGPPYQDQYGFAFLDGELREDNTNGSSVSTGTSRGGVVWVKNGPGTVNSEQAVLINPGTHTLNDESLVFTAIQGFTDTYGFGGKTWGDPDIAAADVIEIGTTGNGSVTIHALTIDYGLRTGTIDMSYFLSDGTKTVTGTYSGGFGIINEF